MSNDEEKMRAKRELEAKAAGFDVLGSALRKLVVALVDDDNCGQLSHRTRTELSYATVVLNELKEQEVA